MQANLTGNISTSGRYTLANGISRHESGCIEVYHTFLALFTDKFEMYSLIFSGPFKWHLKFNLYNPVI